MNGLSLFGRCTYLIFFITAMSSCHQTQTLVLSSPSATGLSKNVLNFEQDSYEVEAHFPVGYEVPEDGIKVHFTRGVNDGVSFISAGLDRNSLFMIRDMRITKSESSSAMKIVLFLQVNHLKLPPYPSPSEARFDADKVFNGVGRVFLAKISYNNSPVRSQRECNAALLGPRLVLTSNHCIEDQADCERASFILWTDKDDGKSTFGAYACERLLVAKPENDQSLIFLKEAVSTDLRPTYLRLEDRDWYFTNDTPFVLFSDFTRWTLRTDKKGKKSFSNISKGEKRSFRAVVEHSSFGYSASQGDFLDPIQGKLTRVLNFYDLSLEPRAGQSGSPVLNYDGNVVGVMNTNTGFMTPVEPDIRATVKKLRTTR